MEKKNITPGQALLIYLSLGVYGLIYLLNLDRLRNADGTLDPATTTLANFILPLGLLTLWIRYYHHRWKISAIGFQATNSRYWWTGVGLGCMFVAATYAHLLVGYILSPPVEDALLVDEGFLNYIYYVLDYLYPDRVFFRVSDILWAGAASIVLAPLYEESLFRGVLQHGLYRIASSPVVSIFIVSFLWSTGHWYQGTLWMAQHFVEGILLGVLVLKSKSVFPAILAHGLGNAFFYLSSIYLFYRFN